MSGFRVVLLNVVATATTLLCTAVALIITGAVPPIMIVWLGINVGTLVMLSRPENWDEPFHRISCEDQP